MHERQALGIEHDVCKRAIRQTKQDLLPIPDIPNVNEDVVAVAGRQIEGVCLEDVDDCRESHHQNQQRNDDDEVAMVAQD